VVQPSSMLAGNVSAQSYSCAKTTALDRIRAVSDSLNDLTGGLTSVQTVASRGCNVRQLQHKAPHCPCTSSPSPEILTSDPFGTNCNKQLLWGATCHIHCPGPGTQPPVALILDLLLCIAMQTYTLYANEYYHPCTDIPNR
jgi:hypothetical protein